MLVSLSKSVTFHSIGFSCALMSTLIFVLQNIFSKKLFQNARAVSDTASTTTSPTRLEPDHRHRKNKQTINLDKLNLLFYSSFLAFVLMLPIWVYCEGHDLLLYPSQLPTYPVSLLFLANGIGYFCQNLFAFSVLSLVSPVTYSIASLVKRIFIISASMLWFGDSVTLVQGLGIALTFTGVYLYDCAKLDVVRSEARLEAEDVALPVHRPEKVVKEGMMSRSKGGHTPNQL